MLSCMLTGDVNEAINLYKSALQIIKDSNSMALDDPMMEKMRIDLAELLHVTGRFTFTTLSGWITLCSYCFVISSGELSNLGLWRGQVEGLIGPMVVRALWCLSFNRYFIVLNLVFLIMNMGLVPSWYLFE